MRKKIIFIVLLFLVLSLLVIVLKILTCKDSNEQCQNKVDSSDCSYGVWCDFFGRKCGGASCVGLGTGKCLQEKCLFSPDYEKMLKQPPNVCIDSDSQCATKKDGSDCTDGIWCDSEGKICGGQSCVGMGLGKCLQEHCVSSEEYRNLLEHPEEIPCADSPEACRCLEKCRESGPLFIVRNDSAAKDCAKNSRNKTCCCHGV